MNLGRRTRPTSAPRRRGRRSVRTRSAADEARDYERVRRLLLDPEHERIASLEERSAAMVSADEESVGKVLPEAIAQATGTRHNELAIALEPSVTTAVESMARRRPDVIGEILAPTIGTAVRKAVAEAIAVMLERFDAALDRSLSLRSLTWRLEAARTKRPFSEVVLLHTLAYRIEQAFLIHTQTSLVLQHVVDSSVHAQAPDQVAAMLAAIDSFGHEALGPMPAQEHLDKFTFGELVVWVDRDPSVMVVAVSRGSPGAETARRLTEVRERILLNRQNELAQFHGDPTPFAATRADLEALLCSAQLQPPRRAHIWLAAGALLVIAAVVGVLWRGHVRSAAAEQRRAAITQVLSSEPGIVLTSAEWNGRRGRVTGLHDPLAPAPEVVLARRGLADVDTDFRPYVSLDPRVVAQRAERALAPPPSAHLALANGTLRLSGVAPRTWIDEARLLGRSLPGIERIDDSGMRSSEALEALRATAASLDEIVIPFATGQASMTPAAEREVRRAADVAKRGLELAADSRLGACIEVTGHADHAGTSERNQELSDARASVVARRFADLGIDATRIHARGAGEWEAVGQRARSVVFHLDTPEDRSACGDLR